MRTERLGENAIILIDLDRPAYVVADTLRTAMPELLDVVPSYGSVGLYFSREPSLSSIESIVASAPLVAESGRLHEIPVCYEMGEDLSEVASLLGLSSSEVSSLHSGETYRCAALGFKPGFAYLERLPAALCGLPRRPSPRVRVPAGSLAITGSQTAVYPIESPGGWWLIGKTPLTLVDLEDDYFPISAGDTVRFRPIGSDEFLELEGQRL